MNQMRLKLLAKDIIHILDIWWDNTRYDLVWLGYLLGVTTGILYLVALISSKIEQLEPDSLRSIIARCYWGVPLSLSVSATLIAIPYVRVIQGIKKKYQHTSETLLWWYVKYVLPVSKAPLYINYKDDRIRGYVKELLKGYPIR